MAALGAAGSVAEGAAGIAKAVNDAIVGPRSLHPWAARHWCDKVWESRLRFFTILVVMCVSEWNQTCYLARWNQGESLRVRIIWASSVLTETKRAQCGDLTSWCNRQVHFTVESGFSSCFCVLLAEKMFLKSIWKITDRLFLLKKLKNTTYYTKLDDVTSRRMYYLCFWALYFS